MTSFYIVLSYLLGRPTIVFAAVMFLLIRLLVFKPSECPPPCHFQGELEKFTQLFAPSLHVQYGPLNSKRLAGRAATMQRSLAPSVIEIKIQFLKIIILYLVKVTEVLQNDTHDLGDSTVFFRPVV